MAAILHTLEDPMIGKCYNYQTRDEKEEKLLQALQMSLEDKCPPERENYLCEADETEQQDCARCWVRWATKDYKTRR